MAGITETGFETKRLPDIQTSINNSAIARFGEGVNLEDDTILGQMRDILSDELRQLWEGLQATYDSSTPSKAEGINLDDVCARVGIKRLDAKPSEAVVMFKGTNGTIIPSGSLVAVNTTQELFYSLNTATISPDTCYAALIDITVVTPSALYTVNINGSVYSITSGGSPTANAIATSLKAAIDADTAIPVSTSVISNRLYILSDDPDDTISVTLTPNMSFFEIDYPVLMNSVNTGFIYAPVNQLSELKSSISGITSVTNVEKEVLGRNRETDTELRLRRAKSLAISGVATLDAIVSRVAQVDSVTSVTGTENKTLATVSGIPGKAFEIVVSGGDDTEIAQAIWDSKPAGIEAFGTTSENATDSSGTLQAVGFTRPTNVNLYVDVRYSLYSEELFPSAGENTIKEIVLATGSTLNIGNDVIAQRFFGPIYQEVPGIGNLSITLATSAGTPPYGSTTIAINSKQVPVFDTARITVTQV